MKNLADQLGIAQNVLLVLCSLYLLLLVGTVFRLLLLPRSNAEERRKKIGSLSAWWIMTLLVGGVVLIGPTSGIILIGSLSILALREYLKLTSVRIEDGRVRGMAYITCLLQYVWVYLRWSVAFWICLPVCVLLIWLTCRTRFQTSVSSMASGVLQCAYFLSHAALLLALPHDFNHDGGTWGLFLFLLVLTEGNDIAQALWGRKYGRHKVTPTVSPHKSWEGLVLGTLTTIVLSLVLSPLLTPFAQRSSYFPVVPGLLISIGGFLGDLSISVIKRKAGVKDAGHLIPGQGGILDRVDSLTFTAPLLFYFVYFLYV